MSATEVLRRAGGQRAAVESSALELRPRQQGPESETREARPERQDRPFRPEARQEGRPENRGEGGGDHKRRRRRRGRGGRGGEEGFRGGDRSFRDRGPRQEPGGEKPGLLQKLKGLFGFGKPKNQGFGDKW
jgi:hypothetical protein